MIGTEANQALIDAQTVHMLLERDARDKFKAYVESGKESDRHSAFRAREELRSHELVVERAKALIRGNMGENI